MEPPVIEPIFEDFRGASWSVKFPDNREMILIYTKKGMYRGGHYHDKPETSMLLTGKVHYWKEDSDGKKTEFDELPGQTLYNKVGDIHLALFTEESWLLDWKIDTKVGECKTTNVPEYRSKVDAQAKEYAQR